MHNLTKVIYRVVFVCLALYGSVMAKETELPDSAQSMANSGDNPRYDFESLMIINLMEKAEFTVITSDGQKHRGHVEVTSDGLIVHKYDKIISGKDRLIAEKAIPFYQIQDIEYKPPNKVNLFKYFILGLTAITAVGVFAPH